MRARVWASSSLGGTAILSKRVAMPGQDAPRSLSFSETLTYISTVLASVHQHYHKHDAIFFRTDFMHSTVTVLMEEALLPAMV